MAEPIQEPKGEPTTAINLAVLAALMALLALTIGAALIDVDRYLPGHGWAMPLALGIAATKGVLVIAYFMHVRYVDRLTRVFVAAGMVWLVVMLAFIMAETATR